MLLHNLWLCFFFKFYVHHWRSFSPHNHWWLSSYASLQFWQCQSSSPNMTFEGIFKQVGWYQPWHNEHCTMTSLLCAVLHTQWTLTVVCLNFCLRNFASILNSIFPVLKHLMSSALIWPSRNWQFSGLMLLHSAYANPIASKPQLLLLVCCWTVGNMTTNWCSFGLNIHDKACSVFYVQHCWEAVINANLIIFSKEVACCHPVVSP